MPRRATQSGNGSRRPAGSKYDAHHSVLSQAYGALADLRRELADTPALIAERREILSQFASCSDAQRAWLLLEDYFERLNLSRRDFPGDDWWHHLLQARDHARLERLAFLFLRAKRSLPSELQPFANAERFARAEQDAQERALVEELEKWLAPPKPAMLDQPRAQLRVLAIPCPRTDAPGQHQLRIEFALSRPRTGERIRSLQEILDLHTRAAHEEELFSPADWEFITWLAQTYKPRREEMNSLVLVGQDLLHWLARWGNTDRLLADDGKPFRFEGRVAELEPHVEILQGEPHLTYRLRDPQDRPHPLEHLCFFAQQPPLVLADHHFYLLRNLPPAGVLAQWSVRRAVPVQKLTHRLLQHLRQARNTAHIAWDRLFLLHRARPRFIFELLDDSIRLQLQAVSEQDGSLWKWTGTEWHRLGAATQADRLELLDDPRLGPAIQWLKELDWFSPEPGLWTGDPNENFLNVLAQAWPRRPPDAEYLGNPAFHRLFLQPRRLRPRLMVRGSGIDWLSVCAEWEAEGLQLTQADIERLATATQRYVRLPNAGWVELDVAAVQEAHEVMADLGMEGLVAAPVKVALQQAAHWGEGELRRFVDSPQARELQQRLQSFRGVPSEAPPGNLRAELRPYQKLGFDFLCHLSQLKLGGILADDMGLGKTLQTLAWLLWLKEQHPRITKPSLVICPASVLHNWRREAERFTPDLSVLVLESGAERHNLRRQIPQHDLIVTNYALLRRDLEDLQKFSFRALVLDEAQFIKNPGAQVTQSVKLLKAEYRLALTGTPLENRLLDLWSIVDFVQPGYLGTQEQFLQTYEPGGPSEENLVAQRIARRRLAAKLRPLMLRRLKKHVAQDLPDRIEQRRDCPLGEEQRKLYLAELRRSRDQVMRAIETEGLQKSKMHVLAALTRLRQICCHPRLVGSDAPSGKTETLFELLDPLVAEGQKVLVFSQFVQMLQILEAECRQHNIPTYILTGQTRNRQELVAAFQNDAEPGVFLLSLRAAGTGLNLTSASYVILYDPWWNPAVEAQAIDRSHRIGQTHTVNAYRLIAPHTVEEKIWDLQQRKAQTIADVLGEQGFARSLTRDDLEYLFAED
ncbi:MAG: DEAD/DEAH box helicase [Verrucomicrobiota bacterium]|nr:DEAD/DEAH box helicase [Limisphaera sp.]MDW8381138.1 DEAD/DEAH box helicase [Verrucomicrobiota bacterium]